MVALLVEEIAEAAGGVPILPQQIRAQSIANFGWKALADLAEHAIGSMARVHRAAHPMTKA